MIRRLIRRHLKPPQLVVLSFALVVLAGAAQLSLPAATQTGEGLPPVDAFSASASATCVTGLAVVNTGTAFQTFGQLVILYCIRIGGLGLMTYTAVPLITFGRRDRISEIVGGPPRGG